MCVRVSPVRLLYPLNPKIPGSTLVLGQLFHCPRILPIFPTLFFFLSEIPGFLLPLLIFLSTGIPHFSVFSLLCFTDVVFCTNYRQNPPPAKRLQLALLRYFIIVTWKGTCKISEVCLWMGLYPLNQPIWKAQCPDPLLKSDQSPNPNQVPSMVKQAFRSLASANRNNLLSRHLSFYTLYFSHTVLWNL